VCANESIHQLWKLFRWWFLNRSTNISLAIFESTGAVCTDESIRRLLKLFLWWILRRQGLSFPWIFPSKQGMCALTNPMVISASSFVDDFWIGIDWVFLDYLKVYSGCVRWRIHTSAMEAVLMMISEAALTQIYSTISQSIEASCADESMCQLLKQF
jgi:hypothetical protein